MDSTRATIGDLPPDGSERELGALQPAVGGGASSSAAGEEGTKIVEWEGLQQELARLWSLSSALKKARERKEFLGQKLESVIEVKRESLRKTNELEEMNQKLEARKLAMGEMIMQTKITLEDVKSQRERLCIAIRTLLVAGKTLSAAHQQLQEANKMLSGKRGYGHLKNLRRMLRMRQQYMVTQVAALYPVKAFDEQVTKQKLDSQSNGDSMGSSSPNVSMPPQLSSLTILGLQLTVLPFKKMSYFSDKREVQKSATVLGYVAHAVLLLASYLDVPLRYPLRLGGSHSYVQDYAPSVESMSDLAANSVLTSTNAKPVEFPLFLEGQDTTRASYAIFLLNKDLEQLLNYFAAESLGPRHVLPNLKELIRIIQSSEFVDS